MSGSYNRCYKDFSTVACEALNNFKEPNTKQWLAVNHEYDALTHWFADIRERKEWTAAKVRVGGLAVYGWMPRMLRSYGSGDLNAGGTLEPNFADIAESLNANDLDNIPKDFLNRSFVGTSKFLHFCFPDKYAIWDSNVVQGLGWTRVHSKVNIKAYQGFMQRFCEKSGKSLRDVEVALFLRGQATQ